MYAHGASELKNRPVVNTVEYLKSKAKKPAVDNSKLTEDLTLTDSDHDVSRLSMSVNMAVVDRCKDIFMYAVHLIVF